LASAIIIRVTSSNKEGLPLFIVSISAVYVTNNPVQHRRIKYIEIDIHFVREKVALGQV
jgi:hypothetical protein